MNLLLRNREKTSFILLTLAMVMGGTLSTTVLSPVVVRASEETSKTNNRKGSKETPAVFAPDTIKSEIGYLASDELRGRGSGEPGNVKAAQFVARAFHLDGLKPLGTSHQTDTKAALDGSGYYQPFPFIAGRVVGKNNSLKFVNGKATLSFGKPQFEPSSISGSGSAEGPVVFVGYGINAPRANHTDYLPVDVKDKIVLLLAGSPKDDPHSPLADYADIYRKCTSLRDLGAKAVLVIPPKSAEEQGKPRTSFDNVSDAGIPVLRIHRLAAETLLSNAGKTSLNSVQAEADDNKNVSFSFPADRSVQLQADVKKVEKVTANIVGVIEGSDPVLKNEYLVIGAHVDHLGMGGTGSLAKSSAPAIHHGADDNASGAAGVIEMARYFSLMENKMEANQGTGRTQQGRNRTVASIANPRPKRSIILICFSGEELGLLGSDWFVKHSPVPLDKIVAMLNMDMIGRLRDNKLTVIGSGTSKEWDGLLDTTNKTAGFALAKSEGGFGGSDHESFYAKNIPVLFFFTGTHPQYHTPEDTIDLINAEGEAKVLHLVADCALHIANQSNPPDFQRVQTPTQNAPSRGMRVYFGSVPDYAAMVEGVQLNGVREGSPAEKAGLKAGDIIIKFGDKVIKNVYDYTYALQDSKPGDMVVVAVKRGDKALLLTVTLAARPE